ncbi:hypothetical protein BP6252_02285 [Coleophoma cylindrospora]|uniref:TM7S3/TM198-like domain-containing protein n=1 Tax=Coleophoma cylindrospora TaxID=1849047 RepID=A0A3D8SED8_9HELO|nr:hypothetical protein BP6252_02285 [Coleophoma cylindrospora]
MRPKFLAFLALCFCIQLAAANRYVTERRDSSVLDLGLLLPPSMIDPVGTMSIVARANVSNSTIFNSTVATGQLPIQPSLTPGFAVAGAILIITGLAYTLVGSTHRLLQISLSAGYLVSVSVTVLILYVMNLPVSSAIQGAFVVAVVLSGVIFGAAACIFPEVTEGLGTFLGGFCFSMWLLVLKPGGLLTSTGSKIALIIVLSLAAFSASFSHVTRPYGLIGGVSFAGATAVVLGVDCFSRAGLKEFWAYIWSVNGNLFPHGTDTYPVTKPIRVEVAVIIILAAAGVVSQMKLSMIKKKQESRSTQPFEDKSGGRQDKITGIQVHQMTAIEQRQWEDTYGENTSFYDEQSQRDSGVGTMERKGPGSFLASVRNSRDTEVVEMTSIPPSPAKRSMSHTDIETRQVSQDGGSMTPPSTHVIEPQRESELVGKPSLDNISEHSTPEEGIDRRSWIPGADGEAQLQSIQRSSHISRSDSPTIVPLPFSISQVLDSDQRSTRSSVAGTCADDDQAPENKRLSEASDLLRRASGRSHRNPVRSPRTPSLEDLITPNAAEEDRRSSVCATVDDLSDDEDSTSQRTTIQSPIQSDFDIPESPKSDKTTTPEDERPPPRADNLSRSYSTATSAFTVGTEILDVEPKRQGVGRPALPRSPTSSSGSQSEHGEVKIDIPQVSRVEVDQSQDTPGDAESKASGVGTRPVSFTKEALPLLPSKVVMSYRTNEWAKHLSNADAPAPEELNFAAPNSKLAEMPVPLDIRDLQQTGEAPWPAPASRNVSQISTTATKRKSLGLSPFDGAKPRDPLLRSIVMPQRAVFRTSTTPIFGHPIVESPGESSFPSSSSSPRRSSIYSPPIQSVPFEKAQLHLGKRNTLIRENSTHGRISSGQHSGSSSEAGSPNRQKIFAEDDTMSLAARRNMIRQSTPQEISAAAQRPERQSSLQAESFNNVQAQDPTAPQRLSQIHPLFRPQMAQWRASVQKDSFPDIQPNTALGRQHSELLQQRQAEEHHRAMAERNRRHRASIIDEHMRRGTFHEKHRDALRKMQSEANRRL